MQPSNIGRNESTDQSGNATRPYSERRYISESRSPTPLFPFVDYNEESKVFDVQQAFISAYRCVTTIVEPEAEMRSMGWVALSRTVEILRRHENHSRVRDVFDMDTLLGTLLRIIYRDIIPLASSEEYLEEISTEDFRAMRPLMTECAMLSSAGLTRTERSAILLSVPKWVLYRCLERGIQRKNNLDFSNLGLTTTADLDGVARLMKLFKPPFHGVRTINLSNNHLTCITSFFLSVIPELWELNVTGNPITTFPISIIKSPLLLITWTDKIGNSIPTVIRDRLQSSNDLLPRPRQTLIQCCFKVLHRYHRKTDLLKLNLSPRVRDLIAQSYSCELCGEAQGTQGEDWIRKVTARYGQPATYFCGHLCVPCRTFLRTGKSLRRSDYLSIWKYKFPP